MRARLIGENIGNNPALHNFGQNVSAIANQSDRKRKSIVARCFNYLQRFIKRARDLVAITALQSFLDPGWIDFDAEKNRAVHRRSKGLRAAHSAEPAGQNKFSF